MMSRLILRRTVWLLAYSAVVVSCERQVVEDRPPPPQVVELGEQYPLISRVELYQDDLNLIGSIKDIAEFEGDLVLVDGIEGNVKQYALGGDLRRSYGRPGDGPGEFRGPVAVVEVEGLLAVRDNEHHRVTLFRPDGAVNAEWRFELSGSQQMAVTPNGDLVLAGRAGGEFATAVVDSPVAYHSFTRTGDYRGSFGQSIAGYSGLQRAAGAEHVIVVGSHFVTGSRSSDTVGVWAIGADEPKRTFSVGMDIYEPIAWPESPVSDIQEWITEHMWLHALLSLTDSTFLAVFIGPSQEAQQELDWWYVEAGLDGTLRSVALGRGEAPAFARNDTLVTVQMSDYGDAYLITRSLRTNH